MFELRLSAALEVLHATIGCEASGIPESDGVLHAELVLKGVDDHLLKCCGMFWSIGNSYSRVSALRLSLPKHRLPEPRPEHGKMTFTAQQFVT